MYLVFIVSHQVLSKSLKLPLIKGNKRAYVTILHC